MVMLASFNELRIGKSLAAQWLGLSDFTTEGPGSVLGWESKIPQAVQSGEKIEDCSHLLFFLRNSLCRKTVNFLLFLHMMEKQGPISVLLTAIKKLPQF